MKNRPSALLNSWISELFTYKFSSNLRKRAEIEVVCFVIVTYGLSYALLNWAQIYFLSSTIRVVFLTWGLFVQMWIPGMVSTIFRIIFKRGFNDIGWKIGKGKYWWLALLIPLSVPLISYPIAFLGGNTILSLANFQSFIYRDPLKLFALGWPSWYSRSFESDLLIRSIVVLTIGLAINFVFAFGEELGWRGYLQQRIIDTKFKYPYALCSLIWAGWHFPFLWYLYNPTLSQLFQILFFIINVVLLGIIIGHLRIASGSVWIPTIMHAAHNTFIFELFAAVVLCGQCELYIGENGILMGMIYGFIVFWMLRSSHSRIRPNSPDLA